jgi:hypothetical protein
MISQNIAMKELEHKLEQNENQIFLLERECDRLKCMVPRVLHSPFIRSNRI